MIEVRTLAGHAEYAGAVQLQKIIWNFDDIEVLPVRLFVTAVNAGGHALGAFDGERMIAFCLTIPGIKRTRPPGVYLHSHMLGVLGEYRNAGVGRMLKLAQRENALARGIGLIEWTFDPFEVKNAFFNIGRLGAIVRRYVPNMYGTTTSPLHSGLPTDRLVAEWWIGSQRVTDVLSAMAPGKEVAAKIAVPAERTLETQTAMREAFQEHFRSGLTVTGFDREQGEYLLAPWRSE